MKPTLSERLEAMFNPNMRKVLQDPNYIALVDKPSIRLQVAAVRNRTSSLMLIDNPSFDAQKIAVEKEPIYLRFIKRPAEELKRIAIEKNPLSIEYIEKPSAAIQMLAVKSHPRAISFIKSPNEKVQFAIIEQDPRNIFYINKPSIDAQVKAVTLMPSTIKLIDNPCIDALKAAIKVNPTLLDGMVIDDFTRKMLSGVNSSVVSTESMYYTLSKYPEKFMQTTFSNDELSSLYELYLSKPSYKYIVSSAEDNSKYDTMMDNFCKGRKLSLSLQEKMIDDRLANISHIDNPEKNILLKVLARMTGVENCEELDAPNDSYAYWCLAREIKELAQETEAAYLTSKRPLSQNKISQYENNGKPYDEQEILREYMRISLSKSYDKFEQKTGIMLDAANHETINMKYLETKHPEKDSSKLWTRLNEMSNQCNKAISDNALLREAQINNALVKVGCENRLSKKEMQQLLKKGKVTIDGNVIIQKINTPKGFQYRGYNITAELQKNNIKE